MDHNNIDISSVVNELKRRSVVETVINSLGDFAWWVKDIDNKYIHMTSSASQTLYGISPDEVIGKTDLEICKELGIHDISRKQFEDTCRYTDMLCYNSYDEKSKTYKAQIFYEILHNVKGSETHVWRTYKKVYPEKCEKSEAKGLCGFATFEHITGGGVENMLKSLSNLEKINVVEKLSDDIYRQIDSLKVVGSL